MVRLKSRYLLCEVNVSDRSSLLLLDDQAIAATVKRTVARIHGDYGAACCFRFTVKYLNAHTGIVFMRCPKRCYRLIWSALPFITSIGNHKQKVPCFLNCLHVGGTIRTCQKFLIRYNKQQLHRMLPKCNTPEEELQVRKAIRECSLVKGNKGDFGEKAESGEDDQE